MPPLQTDHQFIEEDIVLQARENIQKTGKKIVCVSVAGS